MFTSHETQSDCDHFFSSLMSLLERFNIDFKQIFKNTCIDACKAMSNSISKNFPDYNIIMCYFHMKSNIRSRKSSLPQTEYTVILEEIHKLHLSFNQKDYEDLLEK